MAIKAGNIIHVGGGTTLIDRLQTAGPDQVKVPVETVYELGNYKSVGQVRDIPDLSFTLESYDVTPAMEALLLGVDPTDNSKLPYDPAKCQPLDIKSMFKAGVSATDPYATVGSVGVPYLNLSGLSYKFGLTNDAAQTATLAGDSIYYNPGSTYVEKTAGTGTAGQTIATANPAYGVTEAGVTRRTLNVSAGSKRLLFGVDYTEAYGTVTDNAAITTITLVAAVDPSVEVSVMYSSPTVEEFPQSVNDADGVSVKPAAIRGRDIAVYLGAYDEADPYTNRLLGVQAVTVDWKVTLQKDEEFGNYHVVSQDFDVPNVTGTIQVKPADVASFVALMQKISGVDPTTLESATATAAPVLPLTCVLHDPSTGGVLKTIACSDARFSVPGFSAKVQQKLDTTIEWTSDQGNLLISNS